jgi:hypothetical protein
MKFPTLILQLATDDGVPYDLPDNWVETCLLVSQMIYERHKCGMNVVYGMADGKHLIAVEEEVYE